MFGPGYVWLVKRNDPTINNLADLAILTTYNAGSPFPDAHFRRQEADLNTMTTNIFAGTTPAQYASSSKPGLTAGAHGSSSPNHKHLAPGGADIEILTAVSTWPHVWLHDYGVAGKERYLEEWWKHIDWYAVEQDGKWADIKKREREWRMNSLSNNYYRYPRHDHYQYQ